MGKSARKMQNKSSGGVSTTGMSPRDPSAAGTFAAGQEITRIHNKNAFLVDELSDGREIWANLEGMGTVPSTTRMAAAVEELLDHPLILKYRTQSGHTMGQYIQGRRAEGSLDAECIPSLVIAEFMARAIINACFAVCEQYGQPLDDSMFAQIVLEVSRHIAPLAAKFPRLEHEVILKVVLMRARWRAAEVLLDEVAFPKAA